ncbi:dicarboxylate/amino acid:cation symporter [Halobacteriovorax sp. GB3]|uniref:dicarboxylate/amino acid:cation symporter n=1 Tax=Halobacteriovorax sp. GB3 TaxID=2719615 RepID=UPI0023601C1E|nr:dicarboxylate/amino acid:cation symporter [Halobacteriovorax sp. GB3]MDD0853366.1 dicarboxylate/amino acid:cation symporter [Halobacteriovorax sp. GB3]
MSNSKKIGLTTWILLSLIGGLITGIVLNQISAHSSPEVQAFIADNLAGGIFHVVGKIFIKSIKMLVVPLVFVSLICGVTGIGDIKKLGRVGGKTLVFYLLTTALAITLALGMASFINPGHGLDIATNAAKFEATQAPSFAEVLINVVPNNVIASMVEGNMLQVIFFAMLTGIALASVGKKAEMILTFFQELNTIIMKMITLVMLIAPFGVFCLIAKVFTNQGVSALLPLIKYMLTVLAVLFAHLMLVYSGMLRVVGNLSVMTFFKKFYDTLLVAFSTSSSNATIPVTMKAVTERLGVSKSIASFSVPFGATINMDGTAIMQGVAVVFISQVYGHDLGLSDFISVILTATLASIGTAGVPGVGLITLSMVLTQVNLPVEGIALIIGVDRLLDMTRTAVNISGDAIVSILVAKSEQEFDESVYNDKNAGQYDVDEELQELNEHIHEMHDVYDHNEAELQQ